MKKQELKEILKETKHIHGYNISNLNKKQLQNIIKKFGLSGGCNNPTSASCPNNMFNKILYKKYGLVY